MKGAPLDDFSDAEAELEGLVAFGLVEHLASLRELARVLDSNLLAGLCHFPADPHRHVLDGEAVWVRLLALRHSQTCSKTMASDAKRDQTLWQQR